MPRSFTVIDVTDPRYRISKSASIGGRFLSNTPAGAAKKAAQKACQFSGVNGPYSFQITIQEKTRGSHGNIYRYSVQRERSNRTVFRAGQEIVFGFEIKVHSLR
jgi:hypothetical protein